MAGEVHPHDVLKKYWNYDTFRPVQEDIVRSVLENKDTFALLPTGGGKSICYQVPALVKDGLCLVISPLISLMTDQVDDLKKKGIKALFINSSMHHREIDAALDNAVYGNFKILYVSPERIQTELFIERFKRMNVSFIAVDEAHCISQWGHDFRPTYLEIQQLRKIKDVPILALTATATENVVQDIVSNLELKDVQKFRKSFARKNIEFRVQHTDNKIKFVQGILQKNEGSGIIYIRNRQKCKEISESLNALGLDSAYYHAGLDHETRARVQQQWMENRHRIIVATNAFGMGIDKSDVRFVLHWDIPESLEAFYQEAGRAGRDGRQSLSQVLYNSFDLNKLSEQLENTYPPMDEIKAVYKELALFFQLALGSGYQKSYEFDLAAFCERFRRSKRMVYHSLIQLEKEGLVSLSDGFYQPSTIKITGRKEDVLNFQTQNPTYENLIAFLLRAYTGILEQDVNVDEKEMERKTGMGRNALISKLKYMDSIQIIRYVQSSRTPSILFLKERQALTDLNISSKNYAQRKNAFKDRMDHMVRYIRSEKQCRSKIILEYFGEQHVPENCGHCDVCLSASPDTTSRELPRLILEAIGNKTLSLNDLSDKLEAFDEHRILATCRKLCEDEKLRIVDQQRFKKFRS